MTNNAPNIRIPERELPIRDLIDGDYVRVVSEAGMSYRVPKHNFAGSSDVSELDGKIDDTKTELEEEIDAINGIYYGLSTTSGSAQTKVVTSSDFVLAAGKYIVVSFSQRNSYSGTVKLNINDTGEYAVQRGVSGFSYATPYVPIMYLFRVETQGGSYVYRLVGPAYKEATTTEPGYMSTADKAKLDGIEPQANKTTVDDALSDTSENPVQNKVINAEIIDLKAGLNEKADIIISSASGSIAHFEDGANYDAVDVVAYLEPVQDLHGQDAPYPAGGGKNKIDDSQNNLPYSAQGVTISKSETTYTIVADSATGYPFVTVGKVYGLKAGTYTLSGIKSTGLTTSNSNVRIANRTVTPAVTYSGTFTLNADVTSELLVEMAFTGASLPDGTYTIKDVQLEAGSTATSYAPYSNECPITGHTGVDVIVSPTTDAQDGTTYSITFPTEAGTVYGGYVDATQGKLVVTDANIASYSGQTLPSTWISDRDVYASGRTPTTGAQVVYKLATPIEYDLTPQAIELLKGVNNVWNNGNGSTDVEYKADTKLFIEQLTKPTEDDMTANTAIASGKFFMVGNRLFLSTATIASGDTINPGTNCTEMSLADALNSL